MEMHKNEALDDVEHDGEQYYFCSDRCRSAFRDNPDYYIRQQKIDQREERKIVIVGAGQVGATCAFSLMTSGVANSIILIDINRELAEGHVLDMNHGMSFVQPTKITVGDYSDCRDADIVIVTAGASQKPGETRLDLVNKNTGIFKDIIPRIVEHNPRILLIVTNPVDILTQVAMKISGYPMNRVIGSGTVLDTARFRYLLGNHCQVDARNVHAYIIGEHGDSEVPVWSQINIGSVSFGNYCPACGKACRDEDREELFEKVKNAAYEIIDKKGATYYAIALSVVRIVSCILRDENSVLTVSTLLSDYHGISDVCLSVPVVVNRNGILRTITIDLNPKEEKALRESAGAMKNILDSLDV